jgi:hypothetical protein
MQYAIVCSFPIAVQFLPGAAEPDAYVGVTPKRAIGFQKLDGDIHASD